MSVIVPLPPSYRGGTEEYAYRLVAGLARLCPTRVLTTDVRWDPNTEPLDIETATIDRLSATELFERPLVIRPSVRRAFVNASSESRGMNLHMPFPFIEAPLVREARRVGCPTVLTYHMDADLGSAAKVAGAGFITGAYRRFSAHPALDACDVVVSNSRGYAEVSPVLSRHLSKVTVVAKGVDPKRLGIGGRSSARPAPVCIPPESVPLKAKRVVFVGRLVPYKGVSVLLEATERLTREGNDLVVFIAGKGPLRESLESQCAQLGLQSRVRFLGFVPDAQLGDLYRFADVVTVPSTGLLESTATTLEEAAACGVPTVGSDLPGARESLPADGVRGVLVSPGDPNSLAKGIATMLGTPRPPVPENIRTWSNVVRDYVDIYRRLGVRLSDADDHSTL